MSVLRRVFFLLHDIYAIEAVKQRAGRATVKLAHCNEVGLVLLLSVTPKPQIVTTSPTAGSAPVLGLAGAYVTAPAAAGKVVVNVITAKSFSDSFKAGL